MHDLIRLYTAELADPDTAESQDALDRLLRRYTSLADAADDHFGALPGASAPEHFNGRDQAVAWLDAEHPNLVATITSTVGRRPRAAIALALCLHEFLLSAYRKLSSRLRRSDFRRSVVRVLPFRASVR